MPLVIRLATRDDAEQIQVVYAPYCFTPISFEAEPPSVDDMRGRIDKILTQYPWLVCEQAGSLMGYVYAAAHRERAAYRWSTDTTVYIRQDQHRNGLGRALYTSLLSLLTLQGFVNAFGGVTLPNPASVGLHQTLGFQPIGVYKQVGYKLGTWYDVAWFHRPLREVPDAPAEPKRWADVFGSDAWDEALHRGQALLNADANTQ